MNLFAKAGKSIRFYLKNTDLVLIALCAAASLYGLALVYSAAKGATGGYIVQLASICAGLVVAIIISQIDYEFIAALWPVWGVIALVLVALTYTGLGLNVRYGRYRVAGHHRRQPPADLSAVGAAENRLYHHLLQAFVHGPGTY